MRPAPGDGLGALPMPRGEPGSLWAASSTLRAAGAAASTGPLAASGGRLPALGAAWSGAAAEEAAAECRLVAARALAVGDRAVRAAAVLGSYGDALDAAQRAVASLQASWDATVSAVPVALTAPAPELSRLSGTYAAVVADLELAANVAAHRLRALVGEVVGPDLPGGRGAVPGSVDEPSQAVVRRAVLAGLDLVAGALSRADAARLAQDVTVELEAAVTGDPWAVGRAAALLAARAREPAVAAALWSRLDPATTARLLDALAGVPGPVRKEWADARAGELLTALGASLAVAANPAYSQGVDVETRAQLDAWRGPWLAAMAESVAGSTRREDGGHVGGAWAQGQLLAGAWRAGLSPGAAYASTVGVAVVAADREALLGPPGGPGRGVTSDVAASGRHLVVAAAPDDPVRAVAEALAGDVADARAWLLAPLPAAGGTGSGAAGGVDGPLVVDYLVGGRHVGVERASAAASMAAVGRLAVEAGSDLRVRESVQVASAFVGAVASTAQSTQDPQVFRAALAPALSDLGTLVAAHPGAVTAAIDGSAGLGTDGAGVSTADRLVRGGRVPGTWEVVLADRAAAAAVLGELAFDGTGPHDTGPRGPVAAPALAQVVDTVGRALQEDLVAAVHAERAGDPHAVDAAARRLGQTVGFTLTSAGDALAGRDADVDARNAALANVAGTALDKVALPGMAGKAASPLVRLAGREVVAAALPTGAAEAQRHATAAAVAAGREAAYVEMRALVSRARPWDEAQSPQRWADSAPPGRGVVRFWDDAGTPLPESVMTTAQRRSFTDWRRDEGLAVYDTVPQQVRAGIDAGVRDAVDQTARRTSRVGTSP